MDADAPDLTLLFPCFNEAGRVDRCVDAALEFRARRGDLDVEVLLVDDGSTDGTADALARRAAGASGVRGTRLPENRGKGAALREGVRLARGRVVVCLDADLAVGVDHVDRVLPALQDGVDVTVGTRNVPGARVVRSQGPVRRWMGRAYLLLARAMLGLEVSDVTCGFKGFRREVAQRLFADLRADRWGVDAEVLDRAQRSGLVVREVPVTWEDGGASAVRVFRDAWGSFRELWAARRARRRTRT
jgi:dolichyl-phosphate beta-glucosyltransferase